MVVQGVVFFSFHPSSRKRYICRSLVLYHVNLRIFIEFVSVVEDLAILRKGAGHLDWKRKSR